MLRNHKIFEVRPQPKRRAVLVAAAGCTLGVLPIAARAQAKKAPVVIGWIEAGSPETSGREFALFKEGLANLGLKDGAQIQIEPRWLRGRSDQIAALAADLAMNKHAVIVTSPRNVTVAVAKSVPGVPLVQAWGGSLVSVGLAASLARPGGMITGVSNIVSDTSSKFVELLIAAVPRIKRIGFLVDASGAGAAIMMDSIRRSATHYSIEASVVEVKRREEIAPGLQRLSQQGMQALASMPSPMLALARKETLQFAAAQRWPVISNNTGWVRDGALLSYGADTNAQFRRAAYYVDRILRGTKPADLPVELPTTFDMAVNLRTAEALGLTLPPEIMVRATVVIE